MNVFARANTNQNLTPFERALLKLLQNLLIAAVVAALPAVSAALAQQSPNWSDVLHTAIAAVSVAVGNAFWKWFTAQGDPPLLHEASYVTVAGQAALSAQGISAPAVNSGPLVTLSQSPVAVASSPVAVTGPMSPTVPESPASAL